MSALMVMRCFVNARPSAKSIFSARSLSLATSTSASSLHTPCQPPPTNTFSHFSPSTFNTNNLQYNLGLVEPLNNHFCMVFGDKSWINKHTVYAVNALKIKLLVTGSVTHFIRYTCNACTIHVICSQPVSQLVQVNITCL